MEDPLLLLQEGAAALGIELPPETLAQFQVYLQELQTWNARVNLTGLTSPRDMVIKHFLDSLTILPYIEAAPSLADLGSGAGFPGLVLKLARPDLALTLVESRGKKAAFLEYLVSPLAFARGGNYPGLPDPKPGEGLGPPLCRSGLPGRLFPAALPGTGRPPPSARGPGPGPQGS